MNSCQVTQNKKYREDHGKMKKARHYVQGAYTGACTGISGLWKRVLFIHFDKTTALLICCFPVAEVVKSVCITHVFRPFPLIKSNSKFWASDTPSQIISLHHHATISDTVAASLPWQNYLFKFKVITITSIMSKTPAHYLTNDPYSTASRFPASQGHFFDN